MTTSEKLRQLKLMLNVTGTSEDDVLAVYLSQAEREIITWHYGDDASEDTALPDRFVLVQLNAVIIGYNMRGAEGETRHDENTINRVFSYEDMIHYIHAHVPQRVKVM